MFYYNYENDFDLVDILKRPWDFLGPPDHTV